VFVDDGKINEKKRQEKNGVTEKKVNQVKRQEKKKQIFLGRKKN